jgi:hypothetical protein
MKNISVFKFDPDLDPDSWIFVKTRPGDSAVIENITYLLCKSLTYQYL